jgi:type IV pilus assembly protein PilC
MTLDSWYSRGEGMSPILKTSSKETVNPKEALPSSSHGMDSGGMEEQKETQSREIPPKTRKRPHRGVRISLGELTDFTKNLWTQLDAGVPLLRALEVEQDQADGTKLNPILEQTISEIKSGATFSEALDHAPKVYSKIYRNLVKAGESSGDLAKVLFSLSEFLEWTEEITKTIKKAVRYPLIVLVGVIGVLLFILGFVFPRFEELFGKMGDQLPTSAAVLLETGKFISNHALGIVAGMVFFGLGIYIFLRQGYGRELLLSFVAKVPVAGPVMKAIDLARFSRTLAVLQESGISLVQGIELAGQSVSDPNLVEEIEEVRDHLTQGEPFTRALSHSSHFPPLVVNLVSVGEESGRMDHCLARLADHFDREARERVDGAIAWLEPAITIFLGVVVGGMAAIILSSLYKAMLAVGR